MNLTEVKKSLEQQLSRSLGTGSKRNIVFWYDEKGAFAESIDTLTLDNAKIIKLDGNNMFAVKLYIEETDRESNLLVYSPLPRPDNRENWLTDTIMYSQTFSTDITSINLLNLKIDNALRSVVAKYEVFFNNADRTRKFESYNLAPYTEQRIDLGVMSALCKLPAPNFDNMVRTLLIELAHGKNDLYDSIGKFGCIDTLWEYIKKSYGYMFDEQSLEKLAILLLCSHLSHSKERKNVMRKILCFIMISVFMFSFNSSITVGQTLNDSFFETNLITELDLFYEIYEAERFERDPVFDFEIAPDIIVEYPMIWECDIQRVIWENSVLHGIDVVVDDIVIEYPEIWENDFYREIWENSVFNGIDVVIEYPEIWENAIENSVDYWLYPNETNDPYILGVEAAPLAAATLSLSRSTWSPTSGATFVAVNVTSNRTWTVSSNVTWLTVGTFVPANRTGNGSFRINATQHTGTAARTGTITVTAPGATTRTVSVTQAAPPATLTLSTPSWSPSSAASFISIGVTSNRTWTVSSNVTWLTVGTFSPTNRTGNGSFRINAAANNGTAARSGTITVNAPGATTRTVSVTQLAGRIITLNANGGSVNPTFVSVPIGSTVGNLPTPQRSGHTFAGWFTHATGGSQVFTNTIFHINTTVFARWNVTVTFNATGGIVNPTSVSRVAGFPMTSIMPIPTRTGTTLGQRFIGWYSAQTGGTQFTVNTIVPNNNFTLFARWVDNRDPVRHLNFWWQSNQIPLRTFDIHSSLPATWATNMARGRTIWNNSAAPVNFNIPSLASNNIVNARERAFDGLGRIYFRDVSGRALRRFEIQLNSTTITRHATDRNFVVGNVITSVMAHELAHAIGLQDGEQPQNGFPTVLGGWSDASLMNGGRNRNRIYGPQAFDITSVRMIYD